MDPASDVETIKKAFRREIARYHPDKVTHLGPEFQEMASARAAELTTAYKTLIDPEARAAYDEDLRGTGPSPHLSPASAPPPDASTFHDASDTAGSDAYASRRFEQERAGRDEIVRRAVLARVRDVVQQFVGQYDTSPVRGFDFACVSKVKPSLFRRTVTPSVLVKLAPVTDAAVVAEAYLAVSRARLGQTPTVMLLLGNGLAAAAELARVIEEQRRKYPAMADTVIPVPVDIRDWTAKIPANASDSVRPLVERLRNFVS